MTGSIELYHRLNCINETWISRIRDKNSKYEVDRSQSNRFGQLTNFMMWIMRSSFTRAFCRFYRDPFVWPCTCWTNDSPKQTVCILPSETEYWIFHHLFVTAVHVISDFQKHNPVRFLLFSRLGCFWTCFHVCSQATTIWLTFINDQFNQIDNVPMFNPVLI